MLYVRGEVYPTKCPFTYGKTTYTPSIIKYAEGDMLRITWMNYSSYQIDMRMCDAKIVRRELENMLTAADDAVDWQRAAELLAIERKHKEEIANLMKNTHEKVHYVELHEATPTIVPFCADPIVWIGRAPVTAKVECRHTDYLVVRCRMAGATCAVYDTVNNTWKTHELPIICNKIAQSGKDVYVSNSLWIAHWDLLTNETRMVANLQTDCCDEKADDSAKESTKDRKIENMVVMKNGDVVALVTEWESSGAFELHILRDGVFIKSIAIPFGVGSDAHMVHLDWGSPESVVLLRIDHEEDGIHYTSNVVNLLTGEVGEDSMRIWYDHGGGEYIRADGIWELSPRTCDVLCNNVVRGRAVEGTNPHSRIIVAYGHVWLLHQDRSDKYSLGMKWICQIAAPQQDLDLNSIITLSD